MNKGLNRFAILVACATFFLIIAGALVTSNDAGLATSDWPLSNGQVFPKMVGTLFWEHDNFAGILPTVYRGPYEFAVPGAPKDFIMQAESDAEVPGGNGHNGHKH